MARPSKQSSDTALDRQRKALEAKAAAIKAQLAETRQFQEKAPEMRAKAVEKEQREIVSRYHRPSSIEGPADFRYELYAGRETAKPRKLRKERSKAPLLTFVLLIAFVCVVYYAVRTLWNG